MGDRDPTLLERAGSVLAGIGSLGSRRPHLRVVLHVVLLAVVSGFLVAFLVTQWRKLPDFDWHFRPLWLVLAILCNALFLIFQGELWRAILRSLGESLGAAAGRRIWGQSLLARYVPTNALMVLSRVVLAEREGVSKRVCLASVVYELGIVVSAALIVGAYFAVTLPSLDDVAARYAVLAVIPVVLTMLHPRIFQPLADFALRKLGREPLPCALPFGGCSCSRPAMSSTGA